MSVSRYLRGLTISVALALGLASTPDQSALRQNGRNLREPAVGRRMYGINPFFRPRAFTSAPAFSNAVTTAGLLLYVAAQCSGVRPN